MKNIRFNYELILKFDGGSEEIQSMASNSLVVDISFVVLFFHVEIGTLALFGKVGNGLFVFDGSLSKVKANLGKHGFELLSNLPVSKFIGNLELDISNFDIFSIFFYPKVTTCPCDICQFHTDGILH